MTNMEAVFYAWISKIFTPDDKLIFKLIPRNRFSLNLLGRETIQYRINSNCCRGEEFELGDSNKGDSEKRVFLLGDSWTFGYMVQEERTYAYKLRELLHSYYKGKYKIFVINAGFPGYSSTQGLYYFKETIDFYKPDWVIVQLGANDKNYSNKSDREEIDSAFLIKKIRRVLRKNSFNKLLMKIYFRIRYMYLKNYSHKFLNVFDNYFMLSSKVDALNQEKKARMPIFLKGFRQRASPEEFHCNLREIEEISLGHNARIIFIPPYALVDGNKLKFDENYFYGEPYINFLEEFNKIGIENAFVDKALHLTPRGHFIIANLLFKKMTGLISCSAE